MRVRGMLCALGALAVSGSAVAAESGESIAKKAAKGNVKAPILQMQVQRDGQMVTLPRTLPFLSAGTLAAARQALGVRAGDERLASADAAGTGQDLPAPDLGVAPGSFGCSGRDSNGNKRVNQDCTFRRQAEATITFNPLDATNLMAVRIEGQAWFKHCGFN